MKSLLQRRISPALCLLIQAVPIILFAAHIICIYFFLRNGLRENASHSEIVLPAFGAFATDKIKRQLKKRHS